MSQQELLIRVIRALERVGAEYMVTGSTASSLQGEPRMTHDIDFVVALPVRVIPTLAGCFPSPEYYLDEASVREAVRTRSMFNLLDVFNGDKVDFWIITDEPFDRSRFSRRRKVDFDGVTVQVSSPEDTILAKLRWAKLSGGSAKQFSDALGVYETQFPELDMEYLERWAVKLEVRELLEQLKRDSDIP